jgi:hypothetical protein
VRSGERVALASGIEAVDQHVLGLFEVLFGKMTADSAPDLYDPAATGRWPRRSCGICRRVRRWPATCVGCCWPTARGRQLFHRLYQMSNALMDMVSLLRPPRPDSDVRSGGRPDTDRTARGSTPRRHGGGQDRRTTAM